MTFFANRASFFGGCLAVLGMMNASLAEAGGTWRALTSGPPTGVNNCLLLTDGTVLAMDGGGNCNKLTPDSHGSYANGTWTRLAPMNDTRLFFSSVVLTNGNVYVAGGEYGSANHYEAELYDSLANTWTVVPGSQAPNFNYSDSPAQLLPNGNLLVSDSQSTYYFYNVASNRMFYGGTCGDMNEVCWVKLANGSIFGVDDYGNSAEHYSASFGQWYNDASSTPSGAQGGDDADYLLPNGRVFHVGSTTNTAFYTPGPTIPSAGTLVNGPNLPIVAGSQLVAGESPGAILPSGNVLLELAPNGGGASGGAPGYFYEYNYLDNSFTAVSAPGGGSSYNNSPFVTSMLMLPDGSVLFVGGQNSGALYVYTPAGSPLAAGQPVINSLTQNADGSYHLTGTGLNGISEGAMFGDDEQMACNYPLVRLTNSVTGNVYYARTHDWNNTTVQTGSRVVATEFSLPPNLPAGIYSLVVSAVGNASAPVFITNSPPAAPTGLAGITGNAEVILSWNAVSNATTYNVKRLTTVGTPRYATVATVTSTNCTNPGLVNGYPYSYVVTAISPGGESANSAALTLAASGPPPVPANVTAASGTYARINLNWSPGYGATSYNIRRSTLRTGPFTALASTVNPFYTDSGLVSGLTYYYVVSAVSAAGESANSATVSAPAQTVADFGFEVPAIGSGNNQYAPAGSAWAFSGTNGNGAGLVANGSGFSNPNAPEGVQAAFVQSNGVISQVLSGFVPGTTYRIMFFAAQRPGGSQHGGESWNVQVDGTVIGSYNPGPGATSYASYTATFTASAVTHTLSFQGMDLATGDNTVFLDDVRISPLLQPVAPVVTLATPTNNTSFIGRPVINLSATVATNGNLVSSVQFYYNSTNLIGTANNPPYAYDWTTANTGNWNLFARVVYNGGSVADSSNVTISVINTNVNFGFETPSLGAGNFQYAPAGASWNFAGNSGNGSGIVANGSGFSNPNAPQGTQAAFVQSYGGISQQLYGFTAGTTYTIYYSAAQRANQNGGESWNVMIDNTVIATNNPGGTSYAACTATFTASAASHVLAFVGTDLIGGDNTVFLDNVRIVPPVSQLPPTVALASPLDDSVISAANPIILAATVAANGNNIVGVQYYSNLTNLITQVAAPYAYAWGNAGAGPSTVLARLVYNGTNTMDSSLANITVTNPPPVAQEIGLGTGGQTLSITGLGLASRPYYLNTASNLVPPVVWLPVQTNLSDAMGNILFTNLAPASLQQFFNISAP